MRFVSARRTTAWAVVVAAIVKVARHVLPTAPVLPVHSRWPLTTGLKEEPLQTSKPFLPLQFRMAVAPWLITSSPGCQPVVRLVVSVMVIRSPSATATLILDVLFITGPQLIRVRVCARLIRVLRLQQQA